MFYNILDKKRKNILPFFKALKKDFYLAGETALAFQLGHRDSVDFDFFTQKRFFTEELFKKLQNIFINLKLKKIQEEKDTLTVILDNSIKLSFFYYPYNLIEKTKEEPNFKLASVMDIGCMKLSAITGRAALKDYVDLYFILKEIKLQELLKKAEEKYPAIDINLILKSLVFFEDITKGPIKFRNNCKISFAIIKKDFIKKVKRQSW